MPYKNIILAHKKNSRLAYFAAFAISCFITYTKCGYYINADAIAYLAISEKIVEGEFLQSINAYWSPLISWLLAPLLLVIKNGVLCFYIVNVVAGMGTLLLLEKIIHTYTKNKWTVLCILLPIATFLGFWCIELLTADVLTLFSCCLYFALLVDGKLFTSRRNIILIGLLLYFSKPYCFFFFIIHSLLYFFYSNYRKKQILSFMLQGYAILFILLCLWTALVSYKYGTFTISTAAIYNQKIITPNNTLLHPCDTLGLIPVLKDYTYTAWEEMYIHTKDKIVEKSAVPTNFHLFDNLKKQLSFYTKIPRYGFYIGLFLVLLLTILNHKKLRRLALPFSLLLIYTSGYLLYFINDRYLLFTIILLLIINFLLAFEMLNFQKWLGIFLVSLVCYSSWRSVYDYYTTINIVDEKESYNIAAQLPKKQGIHFATYNAYQLPSIAYYNKWKNFGGTIGYNTDSTRLATDLNKYNIEYLIYPNEVALSNVIASFYTKLPSLKSDRFTIYKRQ